MGERKRNTFLDTNIPFAASLSGWEICEAFTQMISPYSKFSLYSS